MADCPGIAQCPFFNGRMSELPGLTNLYKHQYCQGNYETCARFIVKKAKGGEAVPMDLYPNQKERAQSIIAS